ncbi:MAG: T9SS type A sorting domain-containing protein [Chlorobi bacterium]|nr:T9SS type A sorting domain-containing protein [Chlorobiota bacterium]MCI0714997.1 T9SS type A sorting domain-containing protein [Chlorobiota bacterium]
MIKKFSLFVSFVLLTGILYAQVTPPTLGPGEYWTNLWSLSYDYQTNGSVRYIVQDPLNPMNLCAIQMATRDSVSPPGTNRYVWFSYSSDAGRTWDNGVEIATARFEGFPCMTVRNNIPLVALHEVDPTSRTFVYQDAVWGAGSFGTIGNFPQTPNLILWPHVAVSTNSNIIVAAEPNPPVADGYYSYWNGSAWSPHFTLTNTSGPSGNFSVESGPGGRVFIFGEDDFATNFTKLWVSTDNGVTFTLQTGSDAPPEVLNVGGQQLFAYIDGGKSGIYVGNDIHLVYSVYSDSSESLPTPPNTNWYKHAKIIHWSSSTGVDTVAGRYNMPNMTDTLTHALVTPVCQASLGIYNGVLYCTYTAFLRGNTQTVDDGSIVNAGEIFITYSTDNGNTWNTPVNITNTASVEEKHSSVIRNLVTPTGDSVGVFYLRDMKAGGWVNVNGWGPAPVYGIYKKLSGVIGIKQDLEIVREFKLFQNYPNPFNPTTTISYYIPKSSNVTLKVYNILGSEVATLVNGFEKSGAKEIVFDASHLASGIYYYTIAAGEYKDTKKMVLVK